MGGAVVCPICGAGEETLAHFVTECEALDGVRRRFGVGRGDPLEEVLLFGRRTGEEVERTTKMLKEMYGARRKSGRRCKWIDLHISSADAAKGCR